MKILFFCFFLLSSTITAVAQTKSQEINAVLHDESYVATTGRLPNATATETERIQVHLSYVESLLRSAKSNLSATQSANRVTILNLLHEYWTAAIFPVNRDYPGERRPCFIDANGNICAVGYLVEQTKGREMAESINEKHQYDFLLDMQEPAIEEWASEYGLTLEECAMIQPTYGPPPADQTNYADIKTGYGVSSGLVGGTNIAINFANLSNRFKQNKTLSYLGLVTGTTQVILGLANTKRTTNFSVMNGAEYYTSYKAQNNLSYVNIAMGTTTIITSALNLALQKKMNCKKNVLGLYSQPNYSNSVSMGFSFTRKI
ncbi:hypothetical protein [Terrimonas pollutisoli]|uniref:hypothetical protein n=1 Tax=Terrimonas pollutisoli TaxID=3034147 RepID=UPI0023ED831A|nr:hypothetical protein [Terrimonas sp. H1YJ31]